MIVPETSGTHFGQAVAVGDVNGDGIADVMVGANLFGGNDRKGQDVPCSTRRPMARAFPRLALTRTACLPGNARFAANTHIVGEISSELGTSVAMGDVNSDGFLDVIGGGPAFGGSRGRVYMFYSAGASGVPPTP